MRIGIFGVTAKPGLRRDALMALAEGLSTSGHQVDWVDGGEYRKCELAVIYGYPGIGGKGRRHEVRRRLLSAHNAPILILETPLFGRKVPSLKRSFLPFFSRRPDEVFDRFRVSLNGCFWDDGIFCHEPCDNARWSRLQADLGLTVADYRKSGEDVLIVGQVPGDASLRGLDIIAWMKETAIALTSITDRPIVIRPHPRCDQGALRRIRLELAALHQVGWDMASGSTIRQALTHAWVSVTYSSGAAIDSLLAGVPAIALSPASMAWPVCDHQLDRVVEPTLYPRETWLNQLAHTQWSLAELGDGTVWRRFEAKANELCGQTIAGS